jgi:hypothetical protein
MSREDYISGYLNGVIGNNYDWTREDVELVLGRVLKERGHAKWWDTPIPKWNGVTPNQMWEIGVHERKAVGNLVISYLDTSFS